MISQDGGRPCAGVGRRLLQARGPCTLTIEHGDVTSFEVIARYVEALGGRLDLVADFGDRTVRLPVSDTAHAA